MKKAQIAMIALPFLLIVVALYLSTKKDFTIHFTPVELQVYRYRSDALLSDTVIKKRQHLHIFPDMEGPIDAAKWRAGRGDIAEVPKVYEVNFIYVGESDKRAIINDNIVREGDTVDGMKVGKIEKDRVALIIDGIIKWLKLEE